MKNRPPQHDIDFTDAALNLLYREVKVVWDTETDNALKGEDPRTSVERAESDRNLDKQIRRRYPKPISKRRRVALVAAATVLVVFLKTEPGEALFTFMRDVWHNITQQYGSMRNRPSDKELQDQGVKYRPGWAEIESLGFHYSHVEGSGENISIIYVNDALQQIIFSHTLVVSWDTEGNAETITVNRKRAQWSRRYGMCLLTFELNDLSNYGVIDFRFDIDADTAILIAESVKEI